MIRRFRLSRLLAAGVLAASVAAAWGQASAPAGIAVRPEVAKPLQAAQEAIKANQGAEALQRLAEAEALPGLTPVEAYLVQRIKGQAAFIAGDKSAAMLALEKAASGEGAPAAERAQVWSLVGQLAFELKDYPRALVALRRVAEAGALDDKLRLLMGQTLYLQGDVADAARELQPLVQADEAAGRASPETTLRLLASAQNKAGDTAAYVRTLERLASSYPQPELWDELALRASRKPGFAERLWLDQYRFRRAAGVLTDPAEIADMAQQAQLAGLPAEAREVLDAAVAKGLALSPAAQKLRQQATTAAAKDKAALADGEAGAAKAASGDALVNLGFALVSDGQADKGATLMAQGVAKGGLKRADDARLHLGIAQWKAGRTAEALASFDAVKGSDGTAEMARLWALWLRATKK